MLVEFNMENRMNPENFLYAVWKSFNIFNWKTITKMKTILEIIINK